MGICLASYLYSRKWKDYSTLEVLDRVSIGVAISGFFIRLGNFFNSEILGKPSDLPWAVTFTRVDQIPRHPTQIYESLTYLIVFMILYRMYWKTKARFQPGYIFGAALIGLFGTRFFLEMFKENQEAFEGNLPINMGQILSIPVVLIGTYIMFTSRNRRTLTEPSKVDRAVLKKKT